MVVGFYVVVVVVLWLLVMAYGEVVVVLMVTMGVITGDGFQRSCADLTNLLGFLT